MKKIFGRPKSLAGVQTHYCPGCGHGIIHRLIAESMDELGIREKTIGIAPVGCAVFAYNFFNCDMIQPAHGRGPAIATGLKRALPDRIVFSYQGDGDLAAIGTAEIVHAANRGENVSVIFVNNAVYGMTGGQMAPTTLIGQKTTTTPYGRDPKVMGYPLRASEMLATLDGTRYIERVAVNKPQAVLQAKKAIKKSFELQLKGEGFSMIEVLSMCPTNWNMDVLQSIKWIDTDLSKVFPLGVYKDG
ncbi:MAG: thiamine pyrophosphate-dependent enzyme [archaeon]